MVKNQIQEFEDILSGQGLHSALNFLNQQVSHRFTAIYRFDKDELEIVDFIDKLNDASTAPLSRAPFLQSFCEVAIREEGILTSNSALDKRFDARPYQGVITSYVGLPLIHSEGDLYGTLCHIDYDQQVISDDEFAFLQQAAKLMTLSL